MQGLKFRCGTSNFVAVEEYICKQTLAILWESEEGWGVVCP